MARLNPYALPRPARPSRTRTFTEILGGEEVSLTVTLRGLSMADTLVASDEANRMWTLFGTGEDPRLGPAPYPEPDVTPSRPLFQMACLLWVAQLPEEGEEPYTPIDWTILLNRMPNTAYGLQGLLSEVMGLTEDERKNAPGASAVSSSVPPLPSDASTPT